VVVVVMVAVGWRWAVKDGIEADPNTTLARLFNIHLSIIICHAILFVAGFLFFILCTEFVLRDSSTLIAFQICVHSSLKQNYNKIKHNQHNTHN
jgi:hypothetical protein